MPTSLSGRMTAAPVRVLIATAGSHGDVLPFIALGQALAARGHEVLLFANPTFQARVEQAGLRFVGVGKLAEHQALFRATAAATPNRAFELVAQELARLGPAYYQAMRAELRPARTICIGNSLLFAARLLGETEGVPCATVHLAPSVFQSDLAPARLAARWIKASSPALLKRLVWWSLDRFFYSPQFAAPLNRWRSELGLAPKREIFKSWIHQADLLLALFPDWFAEPQRDWPSGVTLTGFPLCDHGEHAQLSPALEAFLAAGSAPVAFSPGTASAGNRAFFEASIAACRLAGVRGVLLSHFPGQISGELPPELIQVDYAPFGALLPRVAAFVHHGGIGSTAQALRAGVPQLICPAAYDQFDNAQRACRLGVASELAPKHYKAPKVAAALQRLMVDPAVRKNCQQAGQRLAAEGPGIARACEQIEARLLPMLATQSRRLKTDSQL
ncbi:glycosyltransferase [Paucibacter sp. B2R-40]|uniref:glycosyltransferase n=1 Tax=Paucibacter sp. B2R-40 TaxID=2893554 RepID=UPI0021E40347|nr:nucleotide disphospho-sugar-binding domain-containing protein [Paucibacter sp. B2R-40]MCV2353742.1 glycosyltransferase [Paucibacter sp. B2R-40]